MSNVNIEARNTYQRDYQRRKRAELHRQRAAAGLPRIEPRRRQPAHLRGLQAFFGHRVANLRVVLDNAAERILVARREGQDTVRIPGLVDDLRRDVEYRR